MALQASNPFVLAGARIGSPPGRSTEVIPGRHIRFRVACRCSGRFVQNWGGAGNPSVAGSLPISSTASWLMFPNRVGFSVGSQAICSFARTSRLEFARVRTGADGGAPGATVGAHRGRQGCGYGGAGIRGVEIIDSGILEARKIFDGPPGRVARAAGSRVVLFVDFVKRPLVPYGTGLRGHRHPCPRQSSPGDNGFRLPTAHVAGGSRRARSEFFAC